MLQKFPQQKLLRFYAFGTNYIGLAGGQSPVQPVLRSEFEPDGITIGVTSSGILGRESLLMEPDKAKHARLRRLVGQAMTPAAVAESIPTLQDIASRQIRQRLDDAITVSADVLCTDFTLDVAWRQILGLDLRPEEVPVFSKAVDDWITGLLDFSSSILGVRLGFLPHWKALDYLRNKISDKIDELEQKGPDSSTISGMVFAVDDEVNGADVDTAAPKRKLTKDQIIDNVLILILAGSETSASTLAQAILALKLNPDSWNKLVDEQKAMMEKYGTEMTKQTLDDECPYLDSVIRETMRMMPLPTGAPRRVKRTQVIDGYQIPKGSKVMFSPLMTHYNDPTTYKEDGSHMDIQRGGFQPERWLKEETRPSSDFIPMGAGPRYCLGANLAYAEMKVFLATLARSADYSLKGSYEDGVVWKRASILPKPVDGVPIEMVKKPMAVASASA
jgi:cytochrome P450